jgi:primase-polymerase (primpol)-like protein
MNTGICGHCGTTLLTVRAGAKFCSTRCRVYAARAAKKRDVLPPEMASERRFVRFNARKVPLTVEGRSASSTNPDTWTDLGTARASTAGEGIGYVLGNGVGCIDLDHAIVGGVVADWAQDVLAANPDTYVEVSRSGEGFHIFGLLSETPGRKVRDGRNIEVYSVGRYIALTGNRHASAPAKLAPLVVPAL